MLKTATIVPYSGYPNYRAFLDLKKSFYNTGSRQMEDEVLEVPQFIPSIHKSTKQFGFSFSYDAEKVWICLPDDMHSAIFCCLSGRN